MNIHDAFPSKFLKAEHLKGLRPVVTIRQVKIEQVGDDSKPVVYFEDKDAGLALNRTNALTIEEILGTPDTNEWIGQRIRLYATKVDFQGKRVDALRVEAAPAQKAAPAPPRRPVPVPQPEPPAEELPPVDSYDDDIPF